MGLCRSLSQLTLKSACLQKKSTPIIIYDFLCRYFQPFFWPLSLAGLEQEDPAASSSLSSALFVPGAVNVGGDCIVVGEPVPVGEAVVHASDAVVVESCDCGPSAGLKTGTFPWLSASSWDKEDDEGLVWVGVDDGDIDEDVDDKAGPGLRAAGCGRLASETFKYKEFWIYNF